MNTNDEMKMRVPLYVLNPRAPFTKDDYDAGKESYVEITEIEPGSELARAVVRLEREYGASYDRLRQIATYLAVKLP